MVFLFSVLPVFSVVNTSLAQSNPLIERAAKVWKSGQPEQAANMLNPLAESGNVQAQMLMGEIREQGKENDSLLRARYWYIRAALANHAPAQLRLSLLLRSPWLTDASLLPVTPLNTAILAGTRNNLEAANVWLQRAATRGDAQAQYLLGQQFEAQQKFAEALSWYEKAAAQKHPAALNTLAVLLWQGKVAVRDTPRAASLYQEAAKLGYAPAMFNLAGLIAQRQADGDAAQMVEWLRKSASLGYGKAQLQLGRMLLYGDEVPQNEPEAARWLKAAAEQDLGWAQYYLAILLQKSRGIKRDLEASREWFERAAQADIAPAQYELGLIYLNGFGVISNETLGNRLIEKAANAGLPEAKAYLQQLNSSTDKK